MGLSIAISGGIVIFTMMYVMMTFPNIIDTSTNVTHAYSDMLEHEDSILRTDIRVSSLTADGVEDFNFLLSNNGTSKLLQYDKFDIIVTYDADIAGIKTRLTENLTYALNCPTNQSHWCVNSFTNDLEDPMILNTNEFMTINGRLQNSIFTNGLLIVSISTDNGVVTSKSMVVP